MSRKNWKITRQVDPAVYLALMIGDGDFLWHSWQLSNNHSQFHTSWQFFTNWETQIMTSMKETWPTQSATEQHSLATFFCSILFHDQLGMIHKVPGLPFMCHKWNSVIHFVLSISSSVMWNSRNLSLNWLQEFLKIFAEIHRIIQKHFHHSIH